jgi:hypothetical protein
MLEAKLYIHDVKERNAARTYITYAYVWAKYTHHARKNILEILTTGL